MVSDRLELAREDRPGPADPLGLRRVDATPAARLIADEISGCGPMPFRQFMELALYAPDVGYYERAGGGPGPGGDYITSPELHPAFGALLCSQFEEMWRVLGQPEAFWLVEAGPGTGAFAADVLSAAEEAFPSFARCLRLALIERSRGLQARQRTALAPWTDRVIWLSPNPESWSALGVGCVLGNELLDAFPVHRVVMRGHGLQECFVSVDAYRFTQIDGPPSSGGLQEAIATGGGALPEGCYGEVNLEAPAWVQAAESLLYRGYFLFIDYGETARRLYGLAHPRGTLRCYRGHVLQEDPLALVGLQDMTAHIDLTAVAGSAQRAGLHLLATTRQAALLDRLGLSALVARVEQQVVGRVEKRAHRAAIDLLGDPGGLGRLAVMLFGKGVPSGALSGLGGSPPCGVRGPTGRTNRTAGLHPPDSRGLWRLRGLDPLHLNASLRR